MTDEQLVENFHSGDVAAFNVLVERWQHRIHRYALRYFVSLKQP